MPKCLLGEKAATIVAEVIRENQHQVPSNIAILANCRLNKLGKRGTVTQAAINSFISYHPVGQDLNAQGLIAAQRGRKLPGWADTKTLLGDGPLMTKRLKDQTERRASKVRASIE